MDWPTRVAETVLPLSREHVDLARALQEWRYTGRVVDLDQPVETCQLCGHPDIRYQFEIRNGHTNAVLLIGSECVKRFDISGVDEQGAPLDRAATHAKVDRDRRKLLDDARERRMMRSLIRLARVEDTFQIESFIRYYRDKRGAFTPKQLLLLFDLLDKRRVAYGKSDFKMVMKRDREKLQIKEFSGYEMETVWGCMTAAQRKWYDERFPNRRAEHRASQDSLDRLMQRFTQATAVRGNCSGGK